eukprot:4277828-Amphidinium_carterae.1
MPAANIEGNCVEHWDCKKRHHNRGEVAAAEVWHWLKRQAEDRASTVQKRESLQTIAGAQ